MPNHVFNLVFLGNGKSSAFFSSHTPETTKSVVLTNHPSQSNRVLSYAKDRVIDLPQITDINLVKQFILNGIKEGKPTAIVVTTNPERGKNWLDKLLSDADFAATIRQNPSLISFVLPQSPNPFLKDFTATECPVVQLDYYPGIGGVKQGDDGIVQVMAGVKENTNYVVRNSEALTSEQKENLRAIVKCLCSNKEIREFTHPSQINLPTNAFLHTVGIVVHIAEELVKKGVIDDSILSAKTSKEFFDKLHSALACKTSVEINSLLSNSLVGKGFYRQMPQVGPNVLMMEMGDIVCAIREESIKLGEMPVSPIDQKGADGVRNMSHISNHLREKYAKQYRQRNDKDAYSVSLGEFINCNPPYQNPAIVIPTNPDGTINTNHRFFTEELPTLKNIKQQGSNLGIPEEQMEVFSHVINFCESLGLRSKITATAASKLTDTMHLQSKL